MPCVSDQKGQTRLIAQNQSSLTPLIFPLIFSFADWTGNYRTGFTILAVLAGIGSLFFLMAKPPVQTKDEG